jgi:hypothetical protein
MEGSGTLIDDIDLSQLQEWQWIEDATPTCQTPADREHAEWRCSLMGALIQSSLDHHICLRHNLLLDLISHMKRR